ncbi:para-aminobenzoate synthase component I / 4- amino-4-deoxychorismate lyase, putative, partial [Listeria fleischmannii subsp. coloradonensis]
GVQETLLFNEKGELTEFISGNLILELDGCFVTPKLECGLLPGVFRRELLESHDVTESILTPQDLNAATRIFLINSVRGFVNIKIADKS